MEEAVVVAGNDSGVAKPFLKWAGGKRQLLQQLDRFLPSGIKKGQIKRYIEPFVGGGAVFCHIAETYKIPELVISDLNLEVVNAYRTIQRSVNELIESLSHIQNSYFSLDSERQRDFFYEVRQRFNEERKDLKSEGSTNRTAQLIFLNRTCYNGLFRVNSSGEFNVPFGRYKNPAICSSDNLKRLSKVLQRTEIHHGDYTWCLDRVEKGSFVYFDPPYRPISKTANFNSYASIGFDDKEQQRLSEFYRVLHEKGALLMLSNSDPKNLSPNDHFFENEYEPFRIERVRAGRMINSRASARGSLSELLIVNYAEDH